MSLREAQGQNGISFRGEMMNQNKAGKVVGASRVGAACIGILLSLASASAPAKAEGEARPVYQARCEFPRAAWNEEILRVREAAMRECKANTVLRSADPAATPSTEAQDQFWKLKSQHEALLRSAR